jgi:hypothetical protein
LKFLVIGALLALLLLLVYSRIYPYLLVLKKLFGAARTITNSPAGAPSSGSTTKSDARLVRCVSCGTWIPADRAIGNKAGRSVYCSHDCIEKGSNGKERKIAG